MQSKEISQCISTKLLEEPYPTSAFSRTRATWFTNNIVHNYSNVVCSVSAEEIMPWLTLPLRVEVCDHELQACIQALEITNRR